MSRYLLIVSMLCYLCVIFECGNSAKGSDDPWMEIARLADSFNYTDIERGKDDQVDCLGMGSLVARILEWLFKENPDKPNGLEPVKFFLHTRKSRIPYKMIGNGVDVELLNFEMKKNTVIVVHGFLAHGKEPWIQQMADAYLNLEDVNFIVIDWSEYSNTWNYMKAVMNAKNAALKIVKFMKQITDTYRESESWGGIHMIGHSLGSHVCGLVAEKFKRLNSKWEIRRITGLDPAQPCFVASDLSLSRDDAALVDIIHTNGKMLAGIGLGLVDPIGHVDFYPNGGQRQPGCKEKGTTWDLIGIPHRDILESVCSHRRSYEYFTESLIMIGREFKGAFWAHPWNQRPEEAVSFVGEDCNHDACMEMGFNAAKYNNSGVFFVTAANNRPYCEISEEDKLDVLEQLTRDEKKHH